MNKNSFRKQSLGELKKSSIRIHIHKDYKVIKKLYTLIRRENANIILLYIPLKIEVDISPLIRRLRMEKRLVYVPFMEGESFSLVKYRMPLERKKFGIREPKYSKQYRRRKIDLAIVPMVGTDPTLKRVGFGKGMYDRFFEEEQKNIKKTVFISRRLCLSNYIVTNHYDVAADIIITPEKVLFGKTASLVDKQMVIKPKY